MKSLSDCEYTAFVSYAHADDEAWFHWVSDFRTELERGLQARLRGVRLPGIHLSGDDGPVAGFLADALKERVAASYVMIICVHDGYAASSWCLKELEYFHSLFGDEGLRERLYIVAMSQAAMERVAATPAWQRLLPRGDQLWLPFWSADDTERPLPVYLDKGLVSTDFRKPFERLREDLVKKLRGAQPLPMAAPAGAPSAAAPPAGGVGFGLTSPALAPAASAAADLLRARGLVVKSLANDAVFSDFAELDGLQTLVLPFDDGPPLMPFYPGGHLALQRDRWLQKNKPAERLYWLDLRADPAAPPVPGSGAAFVAAAGVRALPPTALADELVPPVREQPAGPAEGVVLYIESNRHERSLWEPLGEQIRAKWDEIASQLAPGRTPPLYLRPRGLPVDDIDRYPTLDDADGVVLLWGQKTGDALVAQIHKVEGKLPGRDGAPGIVAYLMPPQQTSEPVPAWGWQVLRFRNAEDGAIDVVDDERNELERFLHKVFTRRQKRDRAGAAR